MNQTDQLILKLAREVSEIHGALPYLATKDYVDEAVNKAIKAKRIYLTGKQKAALISGVIGLMGAASTFIYAVM